MYSENHKIFLQTIMQEGVLHDEDGKELVIKLFGNDKIKNVIFEINKNLKPLSMMIRTVTCEITGKTYLAIISTILQDMSSFQTQFPRTHLELFRKMLSEIILTNKGCVSSTECLNICSSVDSKFLKIDASQFLEYMVDKKWLLLKNGKYYIGVRSIAELMPYFKATYEDFLCPCNLCKEIVFFGQRCDNCEAKMHMTCLEKYAEVVNSLQCASCKNDIELILMGIYFIDLHGYKKKV
ncbi:hypothetical protein M0802_009061 [Mischocyttarus mexicanus]|nr:hypothetical protein M0802_009061 [Mischocyttarus mexicanus]